jgi:hypothetical protein
MPETASKTNGRCHGDGESHKDAHCVSLLALTVKRDVLAAVAWNTKQTDAVAVQTQHMLCCAGTWLKANAGPLYLGTFELGTATSVSSRSLGPIRFL